MILVSDILYGSYIKYDRMYEMTKYAFYGRSDSNNVNVFIDVYSIIRSLFKQGSLLKIDDSFSIASCIINLAIHIRAYFETRHHVSSKVYIIYGGARNNQSILMYQSGYNEKNILMEDSNAFLTILIKDNMEVVQLISQYLYDIFCVVNYNQEFNVLSSYIIDRISKENNTGVVTPNIIYSKDQLSYQLVAFKPYTFLYRPKKSHSIDNSWVVTKSTLFNAYRGGELKMRTVNDTNLDPKMISLFQAISGVRDRSIDCIINARSSIKLLEKLINDGILINGYNESILYRSDVINNINHKSITNPEDIRNRFLSIDMNFQSNNHLNVLDCMDSMKSIVNLYNPQEVKSINDQYFKKYPLDLNRV